MRAIQVVPRPSRVAVAARAVGEFLVGVEEGLAQERQHGVCGVRVGVEGDQGAGVADDAMSPPAGSLCRRRRTNRFIGVAKSLVGAHEAHVRAGGIVEIERLSLAYQPGRSCLADG